MKKKFIITLMIVSMSFFITACRNDTSQNEIETSQNQTNSTTEQAVETKTDAPTYLTKEELLAFKLLYADKTETELIKLGAVKAGGYEVDGESLYKIGNVEYLYMYFWETPVFVTVKGDVDVEGPRGIAVGDTFESVLAKFPQEKDWQLIYNGEIYGDQAVDIEVQEPCAMVNNDYINPDTNQQGKMLTVLVKYCLPSTSFYFDENDILTSYRITLATD